MGQKKQNANRKKMVLVDGSSYLYRAYHALPPLTNSKGFPTGAVYGVLNMINKLLDDQNTKFFIVVFDAPGKTFRNDIYPEYKANRPPMPEDLRSQIDPIHNAINAMGIPLISIAGVEADDVIGTLALRAKNNDMQVLISTGDKDMAQLVDEDVTLINTMNNQTLNREGVKAKFGVYPNQIIDYLALMGDKSDNVPGIPGVGEKTASKWLNQFQSIQKIIKNSHQIQGKIGQKLNANIDQLPMSQRLVTINKDVEIELNISDLTLKEADTTKLKSIYKELELNTLYKSIIDEHEETKKNNFNYKIIYKTNDLKKFIEDAIRKKIIAIDTETNSLNYMEAELVGISMAVNEGEAAYIPLAHDYVNAPNQLDRDEVLNLMKPLLESSEIKKIGHHLKFDAHIFARYKIYLKGIEYDSMIQSYVLNSIATRHDMNSVANKYLNRSTTQFEEIAGKGIKQLTFNQIKIEKASDYAAEDADVTLSLHKHLWVKIRENKKLRKLYDEIEKPLIPILFKMEEDGVLIDKTMLENQSAELSTSMDNLEKQACKIAKTDFNLGSPKQLQEILFEKLDLPILKKTPKGQPSTAEDVLQELSENYELPKIILEHRTLSKLKSTYTEKLPNQISSTTGRIHTSYHQANTATGRLSSSTPNLQNIPIRTAEGRRIRQAFIAPKGYSILAADYSQIELRIMAHLSKDKALLKAFLSNHDIHSKTAAEVLDIKIGNVTVEQRRWAKAINFGLMYGMSAFGLGKQIGVGRNQAQDYIDLYFSKYPNVRSFMDETKIKARENGFIETLFGRRLYLPDINSKNGLKRNYAERSAINAPMQGSAADIIKIAMIDVDQWIVSKKVPARIIMQVHDELVLEVKSDASDDIKFDLIKIMESSVDLDVPLVVDAAVGLNWDEAH